MNLNFELISKGKSGGRINRKRARLPGSELEVIVS